MSCIADKLDKINSLIGNSDFDGELTFNLLNKIIIDTQANKEEIADALLMKGLIVAMYCSYLTEYEEDETGLKYFIKAFEYNPYELGILFNILNSFTEHDMRQEFTRNNTHMFIKAYDILKNELYDSLSQELKEMLKNYADKYQQFKHEAS
ncbi:hypothetical protein [Psychrobacter sp. I-STPA6b]|uniref:hypothetical protein n=1 Tax=Psychrobacter sp. I-STPA6b TaxID=2585718 RepID=UPI001D0BFFD3|nr:hypothetical protein [Psychrobacter sp. I-STPA6b]